MFGDLKSVEEMVTKADATDLSDNPCLNTCRCVECTFVPLGNGIVKFETDRCEHLLIRLRAS